MLGISAFISLAIRSLYPICPSAMSRNSEPASCSHWATGSRLGLPPDPRLSPASCNTRPIELALGSIPVCARPTSAIRSTGIRGSARRSTRIVCTTSGVRVVRAAPGRPLISASTPSRCSFCRRFRYVLSPQLGASRAMASR